MAESMSISVFIDDSTKLVARRAGQFVALTIGDNLVVYFDELPVLEELCGLADQASHIYGEIERTSV